ncbi:DUF354 domain-containing protein [Pyrococcus abyssi]|uniref:DUF354 domain-containing protein n=1 Tax=Pyrococcus abyssi (strain GE5 / Orsay) TaxID=272844 RepID=Q9V181_PYRAB|nr:DUF354 domain-containing protein [Pyrococcus abyssi]CAB49469.1 Hypothetical protein PAB2000 [Pyrococcus abyssi GE5]CCE69936.1 TPA: hypothetical protein PAB2000 [Pyrococcus abyssi GE5]
MKVWIDIMNSPHAHFFKGIIRELERRGFEVLVTTREFDGLTQILDMLGIDYISVGKHGGVTLEGKLLASAERVYKLSKLIIEEKPDIAMYKNNPEAPRIAFGLKIRSIGFVDNETAIPQNKLMFPFTERLLYPKVIDAYELLKCGADPNSLVPVNSIAEVANVYGFRPDDSVLKELGLEKYSYIVMRPEPIKATYFNGDRERSILEDVIPLLPDMPIVLFPRSEEQKKVFERFENVIIPDNVVDTMSLLFYARIMIGAGGTMNREALALGTPAISTYPGRLLAVTKWLIELGVLYHSTNPIEVATKAWEIIRRNRRYRKFIREVMITMENPVEAMIKEIEESGQTDKPGSYESLYKGSYKQENHGQYQKF